MSRRDFARAYFYFLPVCIRPIFSIQMPRFSGLHIALEFDTVNSGFCERGHTLLPYLHLTIRKRSGCWAIHVQSRHQLPMHPM
jgi:hypothetical protein